MLSWFAPLIVFGLVVFIHELGHFVAAKLTGVYAPVFAFGWGPRLWGFKRGETDYRVSWFPVGGFVAMASKDAEAASEIEGGTALASDGESSPDAEPDEKAGHRRGLNPIPWDPNALKPFGPQPIPEHRWIESKSLLAKVFVLSAGVIMNMVLAVIVTAGSLMTYGRPYAPALIDSVVPNRPAAAAGLLRGDSVVAVSGNSIRRWDELVAAISSAPGDSVALTVMRGGQRLDLTVVPELAEAIDPLSGAPIKAGRVGIATPPSSAREAVGLRDAMVDGTRVTGRMIVAVLGVVKGLFSGAVSVNQLGGPIAIARTSFEAAKTGWENLLFLLAFLSVNIGVLNLLPIPLLDGGQILMRIAESIKGSAFSHRTQEVIMRIGMLAILMLFVLVMFNDIKNIFS